MGVVGFLVVSAAVAGNNVSYGNDLNDIAAPTENPSIGSHPLP